MEIFILVAIAIAVGLIAGCYYIARIAERDAAKLKEHLIQNHIRRNNKD